MEQLWNDVQQNQVQIVGSPVFVYNGATGEMDKPFELQVGFPVAGDTKPIGEAKVRELEKYRCATVLFSGAMNDI
ncbi:hypothetical protein WFJ45_22205, partial [Salmonella enterica subsp. enterica serovar Minnesota]|uniref:hypothetical protein n=1 Tax=Salmonella enterica TaxID=28901 RepID=UPI003D294221